MKVRLIESAHDTWAPAGTVGELVITNDIIDRPTYRFYPDRQNKPLLFKTHDGGIWIGRVKWEEVVETTESVKPRKRGK